MEQKINIAEILKDAPKGTKLYSPAFGEIELIDVTENGLIITSREYSFAKDGKYLSDGECMLFPSKGNRDWSTFQAPWKHKHFEPFQKVLINVNGCWTCDLYSHWVDSCLGHDIQGHVLIGYNKIVTDRDILPYEGNTEILGK